MLDLSRSDYRPRIGDVVRVVPNHVCIAVHLFDEIIGVRGTSVETRWPVTARGRGSEGEIGGGHPSGPRMA
jgi:D-serine deaminase-like pyridoxal phosphate-dependent protein